jgi:hypothetical protein
MLATFVEISASFFIHAIRGLHACVLYLPYIDKIAHWKRVNIFQRPPEMFSEFQPLQFPVFFFRQRTPPGERKEYALA